MKFPSVREHIALGIDLRNGSRTPAEIPLICYMKGLHPDNLRPFALGRLGLAVHVHSAYPIFRNMAIVGFGGNRSYWNKYKSPTTSLH